MNTEKLFYEQRINQLEIELQKAVNTLNEYKKEYEEFIQIASHDLHAPLRKLSTFVERLTYKFKDVSGEEVKFYIARILSTVKNMRSLIDDLYALSSFTEIKNVFLKCDLNELLQNVLKDFQPIISENNAAVTCASLPVIEGDCSQLKYLFQNLINNSIKFKKKDTPLQINIVSEQINQEEKNAFELPADKIYYKIEIMDNGIGFEDQHSKKIFQPFQRLHGISEYGGNGMGLAICKKIMDKHYGIIYANTSENDGARFMLIFPEICN